MLVSCFKDLPYCLDILFRVVSTFFSSPRAAFGKQLKEYCLVVARAVKSVQINRRDSMTVMKRSLHDALSICDVVAFFRQLLSLSWPAWSKLTGSSEVNRHFCSNSVTNYSRRQSLSDEEKCFLEPPLRFYKGSDVGARLSSYWEKKLRLIFPSRSIWRLNSSILGCLGHSHCNMSWIATTKRLSDWNVSTWDDIENLRYKRIYTAPVWSLNWSKLYQRKRLKVYARATTDG